MLTSLCRHTLPVTRPLTKRSQASKSRYCKGVLGNIFDLAREQGWQPPNVSNQPIKPSQHNNLVDDIRIPVNRSIETAKNETFDPSSVPYGMQEGPNGAEVKEHHEEVDNEPFLENMHFNFEESKLVKSSKLSHTLVMTSLAQRTRKVTMAKVDGMIDKEVPVVLAKYAKQTLPPDVTYQLAQLYNIKADCMQELENLEAGMPWREKAMAVNEKDADILMDYVNDLQALGRHEEALKFANLGLQYHPKHIEVLLCKARLLIEEANIDGAMVLLNKVESLGETEDAAFYKATIYFTKKRYSESISQCEKLLRIDAEHLQGLALKGKCLLALKRREEARSVLLKAASIYPNAQLLFPSILVLKQDREEAEAYFKRARKLTTDPSVRQELYEEMVDILLAANEPAVALKMITRFLGTVGKPTKRIMDSGLRAHSALQKDSTAFVAKYSAK